MPETVEAWILDRGRRGVRGELRSGHVTLPELRPADVLVEPLIGSWEANMEHALSRSPIDVCEFRGEEQVVLGNGAVVRVLAAGPAVRKFAPGDRALVFGNNVSDDQGYMIEAWGYDSPGTVGVLAKRTVFPDKCLLPLPAESAFDDARWAPFATRYATAWSNWRVALGAWRLQIAAPDETELFVFGWGGGTTFAELALARRLSARARCFMTTSSDERAALLRENGIEPIDRREFPDLYFEPERYAADADYRRRFQAAEARFLELVRAKTGGRGASVFVDYLGAPLTRTALKALGREGVLATAGWMKGLEESKNRAIECIKRTIHVHTHFANRVEGLAAVRFGNESGWMPPTPDRVFEWDEVPELAELHAAGRLGYFPRFRVNA